ncbi:hypothetical protein GobsT_19010 [Gemmata obscuriglobus]|uniref:Uncharacterized protein n=1 Tax=Gemmata obscuriglobus TaxID=114 RepID=A0A2Z3H1Y3_9BACT|nr:hypothetical protein [Gemmata obscuriglobus]AWM39738.1 hypothetical protein C1280_23880 [Gemmata obscuriglobus]QEG27147.1 hypothetical protein GobsT_19010 [Gemmata obscuriglobus]VTS03738.1 unnamed protein product [Gemmata obscuriglobus UQM 2246]
MPWFALQPDVIEYQTVSWGPLVATRPTLRVELAGARGLQPYTFLDTGAPVSVVSQAVAIGIGAALRPIAVPNPVPRVQHGRPIPAEPATRFLTWRDPFANIDIPCRLAEFDVQLRDRHTGATSGPLTMVAKVLQAPAQAYSGYFVLIGLHLLLANAGQLHLEGQQWNLGGPGLFFPP